MRAAILALDTVVPEPVLTQEGFSSFAERFLNLNQSQVRVLKRIVAGTQIDKRHTVVDDFLAERSKRPLFGANADTSLPMTAARNARYKEEAPKLAEAVCHTVLEHWGGSPSAITHVISVSCTGVMAPGIEFLLIDRLGLSPNVERLGINFMGCFGAFKGLAIAKALAMESSDHRVLVVCTELCSLHFQKDLKMDTLVANALFADGAAAAIVGKEPRTGERPLFAMHSQASAALKNTLDRMTWEAGDYGYKMRLSASVPKHLEKSISPFVERLIGPDIPFDACKWAIHPGGKSILEAIERACSLQRAQVSESWKVLSEYGNLSSPTFLFVLKEVLKNPSTREWVVGLGFGPGLSVEGLLLERLAGCVAE